MFIVIHNDTLYVLGIVGWDYMSPQAPLTNIPPDEAGDTHEDPRRDDRAQAQLVIGLRLIEYSIIILSSIDLLVMY